MSHAFTADQIASACADAGLSDSQCESLLIALHYTPQSQPDSERDAERWRALLNSARIRMIGSAGLNQPEPNNYAHFGMEIWTRYGSSLNDEQRAEMERGNELGRAWLTKYAEIAMAAQQGEKGGAA